MTEKELLIKIKHLGGKVEQGSLLVTFKTLSINNKEDVLAVLEIMRYANDLTDSEAAYTLDNLDQPIEALIDAIKKGAI